MSTKKILGIIATIAGIVGTVVSGLIINDDMSGFFGRYTYSPPYTSHEITMISLVTGCAIIAIIGVVLLVSKDNNQ